MISGENEELGSKLQERIRDYCEWMGQRSFIYPNWQDSRESFLNNYWNDYLDYTLRAIGNPIKVDSEDLKRVILSYQHHSFLNSLTRVFNSLIVQEFVADEKIIWTGMLEDPGEQASKSRGISARRASVHYLLLTEKSLIIKSTNKPLTQKFPVMNLELQPHFNGVRITEPLMHPERDDLRSEIFSFQGTVNGQDVLSNSLDQYSNLVTQDYTDAFIKMISAFAVAAHFFEEKMEILGIPDSDENEA